MCKFVFNRVFYIFIFSVLFFCGCQKKNDVKVTTESDVIETVEPQVVDVQNQVISAKVEKEKIDSDLNNYLETGDFKFLSGRWYLLLSTKSREYFAEKREYIDIYFDETSNKYKVKWRYHKDFANFTRPNRDENNYKIFDGYLEADSEKKYVLYLYHNDGTPYPFVSIKVDNKSYKENFSPKSRDDDPGRYEDYIYLDGVMELYGRFFREDVLNKYDQFKDFTECDFIMG